MPAGQPQPGTAAAWQNAAGQSLAAGNGFQAYEQQLIANGQNLITKPLQPGAQMPTGALLRGPGIVLQGQASQDQSQDWTPPYTPPPQQAQMPTLQVQNYGQLSPQQQMGDPGFTTSVTGQILSPGDPRLLQPLTPGVNGGGFDYTYGNPSGWVDPVAGQPSYVSPSQMQPFTTDANGNLIYPNDNSIPFPNANGYVYTPSGGAGYQVPYNAGDASMMPGGGPVGPSPFGPDFAGG